MSDLGKLLLPALAVASLLGAGAADAAPRARKPPSDKAAPAKPGAKTQEQKEADRHFKAGVALYKEAKYAEALAEFERAYEIAPHPLVLYNIAGCHRELSHYAEAVNYYRRFLAAGKGGGAPGGRTPGRGGLGAPALRVARGPGAGGPG